MDLPVESLSLESLSCIDVLDATPTSILITDTSLDEPGPRILYVNAVFEQMTGYRAAEALGQNPRFLQGKSTDTSIFDDMRERLFRKESWSGRATNYRKDGTAFVMDWSIAPISGPNGDAFCYIAVQRDVTQEIEDGKRLLKAMKAAQEADRAKIDFLAMMNQDLHTPSLPSWAMSI